MYSKLLQLGWNDLFQQQLESFNNSTAIPARITREDRGRYTVHTGDNSFPAHLSGAFLNAVQSEMDQPTVGDWVLLDPIKQTEGYLIIHLLERISIFSRQSSGKTSDSQLLAANIDYLFIIAGLDQDFKPRRIQRYVAQALNSTAQPVIILNKSDLVEDINRVIEELEKQIPDTPIHAISALYQKELECLDMYLLQGNTIALSGSSGVGKSSLINALLGEQRLLTQSNRANDNRGRHTTTWRELIVHDSGPCLIDLPGMRELQLSGDQTGISKAFADIQQLANHCRFRNCRHEGEPGCAIQEALDNGDLDWERFAQYNKLKSENAATRKRAKKKSTRVIKKQNKYEKKESFFKGIAKRQHKFRKETRKYGRQDGF